VYKDLVFNKWWTKSAQLQTNSIGNITSSGFLGKYQITVVYNGETKTDTVNVLSNDINTFAVKFNNQSVTAIHKGYSSNVLTVYPNPFTTHIQLPLAQAWSLFNVAGQLIKSGNSQVIETSEFPSGMYLLQLENGGIIKMNK
jgi:hypothetical protein